MEQEEIPFNKQLRKVTRDVHSISDALVNAKLVFALSANKVWAEGLLVFYEIFRYLEEAMVRHENQELNKLAIEGLFRTEAFENDLNYYLGSNWKKNSGIRPAVAKYLNHLKTLENENPDFLIAYVYHLYMGLLSGGQILKRKRMLMAKINLNKKDIRVENVTYFGIHTVFNLKQQIVQTVNEIANNLDKATKDRILQESKNVFLLNNEIINTVEGTKEIILKKLIFIAAIFITLFVIYYLVFFF